MNYNAITQMILVDDKPTSYEAGGPGSIPRKSLYLQLFAILHDSLPNLQNAYILADKDIDVYTFSELSGAVYTKNVAMCHLIDLRSPETLSDAIKWIAKGTTSLLLMDYILDDNDWDAGKALARNVIRLLEEPNTIKLLYQVNPKGKEETPCPCIWNFPISCPVDAAEEVMNQLMQMKLKEKSTYDLKDDLVLNRDFSNEFVTKMRKAMVMSHYKYGWCSKTYPELAQAYKSIEARLKLYLETHNTEYLVDVANFAMIEFMYPAFGDAKYTPTDSHASPGLTGGISYKQMMEELE